MLGIDSGGTHTRVACVDLTGTILSTATTGGGSPNHNAAARSNIRQAIESALRRGGRSSADIRALTAGIAGLDNESDRVWADEFVSVPGLDGSKTLLNDAEAAHLGAFLGGPGILVASGTGSLIFGVTENGRRVRNYDLFHYAGGARHLARDAIQRIIVDESGASDRDYIDAVFSHWGVASRSELANALLSEPSSEDEEVKRKHGDLAPLVTEYARTSPLARAAVSHLVEKTHTGVELVASVFGTPRIPVVLIGAVATSPAFAGMFEETVQERRSACVVSGASLDPVHGAVFHALSTVGGDVDSFVSARIANRP